MPIFPRFSRGFAVFPGRRKDTLTFTAGANVARLAAAARGERRQEAFTGDDGAVDGAVGESCSLCGQRKAPEEWWDECRLTYGFIVDNKT